MVLAIAALSMAACDQAKPAGQVVATVNGVEITVAELNGEAQARSLDIDSDPSLRDALLRELIERKLLVQQAREQKIDRTPQFLLTERRQREIILAQQLLTVPMQELTMTRQQLAAFVGSRPLAFDARVLATADQLSVAGTIPLAARRQLAGAASLDAMAEALQRSGFPPVRTQENWDSADPTTPVGSGEVRPVVGARFILVRPGGTFIGQISAVQRAPVAPEQRLATARALLQRSLAERRMQALLERGKASAKIAYNPQFAPVAGER